MLLMSPGACQGHVFLAFTQSSCSKQNLEVWKSGQLGLWRLSCGESGCSHPCSFLVDLAHSGGIGGSGNTTRGNSWSLWKRWINLVPRPTESVVWTLGGHSWYLCVPVCHDSPWSEGLVCGVVIKHCLRHRSWIDLSLNWAAGTWADFSTCPSLSFLICKMGVFP